MFAFSTGLCIWAAGPSFVALAVPPQTLGPDSQGFCARRAESDQASPPAGGEPPAFQSRPHIVDSGSKSSPLAAPPMTPISRRRTSHDPAKPSGTSNARAVPTASGVFPSPPLDPPEPTSRPVIEGLGDGLVRGGANDSDGVGVMVALGVRSGVGEIVAVGVGVAAGVSVASGVGRGSSLVGAVGDGVARGATWQCAAANEVGGRLPYAASPAVSLTISGPSELRRLVAGS